MDITPEARERLDGLMDARRLELGIPWREVATRAGISYEALRALRNGPGGTADLTARKIDAALEWAPGSVARIGAGGDPAELSAQPEGAAAPATDEVARIEREYSVDLSVLSESELRIVLTLVRVFDARLEQRMRETKRGA